MKRLLWIVAAVMVAATPALAQDVAPVPVTTTVATTSPSSGTHPAPQSQPHSQGGIALELQGRLPVLNVLRGDTPFLGGGFGAAINTGSRPSVLVPALTLGVRFLDTRLFVGLGVGWYSQKLKNCDAGAPCDTAKVRGFSLSPTVTYDVLSRGAARLYPIGVFNLGRTGTAKVDAAGTTTNVDGNFYFGMNVGLGIRADFNDVFSVGTEWGWGFQHVKDPNPAPGAKTTLFGQGAWGTIFLSARIGL